MIDTPILGGINVPANDEEILSRLELTIQSWSGEVTNAHDTLSRQISEAKDQLSTLMRVIASRNQNGHAITDALEDLQSTKKQLARSAENLAGALEENARIKDQLRTFEAGADGVPSETIEQYENAIEDLNHELTHLQAELKVNEAELQERNEALRSATEDAASFNDTLSAVQKEMESLHAATDRELQEGTPEENLQALEREVREAVEYEDDLADELEQTQNELEKTKTTLVQAQEELTIAQTTIETLQNELEQKHAAAEDFEMQMQKDQEIRVASDQDTRKDHVVLGSEIVEAQAQIDRLKNALVAREDKIDELQTSLSDAEHSKPQPLSNDLDETSEQVDKPSEESEARNRELKATLRDRDAEIDDLRIQLSDTEDGETDYADRIAGAAYDTKNQRRAMGEILVNSGIISQRQLEKALEEQNGNKQRRLGSILVEKGLIADEIVAQVLASQLRLPFIRLEELTIAPEASQLMNGRLATHHMSIPVRYEDGTVTIAMANPHDLIAIEDIEIETDSTVNPVVATLADITSAIVRVYGIDSSGTHAAEA